MAKFELVKAYVEVRCAPGRGLVSTGVNTVKIIFASVGDESCGDGWLPALGLFAFTARSAACKQAILKDGASP